MVDTEENKVIVAIPLSQGLFAIVDAADHCIVRDYNWSVLTTHSKSDGSPICCYAVRHDGEKLIMMHRQLLDYWGDDDIDHKDGNGLNNRRCNIRIATRTINNLNKDSYRIKARTLANGSQVFDARVGWIGTQRHLGTFRSEEWALLFADRAARDIVAGAKKVRAFKRMYGRWSKRQRVWIHEDGSETLEKVKE